MVFLRYYLWIGPHLLLGLFLWVFVRRGMQKNFPWFFTYVGFELLEFAVTFAIAFPGARNPAQWLNLYRWVVVWSLGISSVLGICVIYELVNRVILPCSPAADTLRSALRWSGAGLVLLIAIASSQMGGAPMGGLRITRVMGVFQVLDFSSSALQVGLLAVLFLFRRALRISWAGLPVGIAVGLGIAGSVELSAAGLLSVFGPHRYALLDVVRLSGFHACVLVWLGYACFPTREANFVGALRHPSELESWDLELKRMVQR
jgi:hypothetical protein